MMPTTMAMTAQEAWVCERERAKGETPGRIAQSSIHQPRFTQQEGTWS
jgi:hypothetical protein